MKKELTPSDQTDSPEAKPVGPAAKWAAVVTDTVVPLPRRVLRARDILFQSGHREPHHVLVRDLDGPLDISFDRDAEIDLADGNVFKVVDACDAPPTGVPATAPPKLAFIADDTWEITIQPAQTLESLRGLFDLPDDAEFIRDFESPHDQIISPGVPVDFADGPVFLIRHKGIPVKVNNQPVTFEKRRDTGLEIKKVAIAQGVAIDLGFVLYRRKHDGALGSAIADGEHVVLRKCDEFRCVAPDDNS